MPESPGDRPLSGPKFRGRNPLARRQTLRLDLEQRQTRLVIARQQLADQTPSISQRNSNDRRVAHEVKRTREDQSIFGPDHAGRRPVGRSKPDPALAVAILAHRLRPADRLDSYD